MNQPELPGTKQRILDAAERLFAERGFAATSLRSITAAAGVNLAAVNYHFRSKEALLEAVFARRLAPLNQKRLELLDACEARARKGPLPLEAVIEAFFAPVLRLGRELAQGGRYFQRLMGRMYVEPGEHVGSVLRGQFAAVAARFTQALRRALPKLPPVELMWRIHFMIGAMAHTLAGVHYLEVFSGGLCDPSDVEGTIRRLGAFLAAGLKAPPAARRAPRSHK